MAKRFENGITYIQSQGAFWADLMERFQNGERRIETKVLKHDVAEKARLMFLGMKRTVERNWAYEDARIILDVKCSIDSFYSEAMEKKGVLIFSKGQPLAGVRRRIVDEQLMGATETKVEALQSSEQEDEEVTFESLENEEIRALTLKEAEDYYTSNPHAFCGYPLPEGKDEEWARLEQLRHDVDSKPASSLVMKLKVCGIKPGTSDYTDIFSNPSTNPEWKEWAIRHTWLIAICKAMGKPCYVGQNIPVIRNDRGIEILVNEYVGLGLVNFGD